MSLKEWITWKPFEWYVKPVKEVQWVKVDLSKVGMNKRFDFKVFPNKEKTSLSSQLYNFGFREPMNLRVFNKFIEEDDIVLDIGANIGFFTIMASKAKQIIAVEPIEECFPLFLDNIDKNQLYHKVIYYNCAVSNEEFVCMDKTEAVNLSKVVKDSEYKVKAKPLSYFADKYKTNMVKLDAEGYEYEIIIGGIPKEIDKMAIELHTGLLGEKKVREIFESLKDQDFYVKYMVEDLPLRLYPMHKLLLDKMAWVKLFPQNPSALAMTGRQLKHIYVARHV